MSSTRLITPFLCGKSAHLHCANLWYYVVKTLLDVLSEAGLRDVELLGYLLCTPYGVLGRWIVIAPIDNPIIRQVDKPSPATAIH